MMNLNKQFYLFIAALLLNGVMCHGSVVTLGQSGLMSLDYHYASESLTAQVTEKRISGQGVEFDILFEGNSGSDSQIFYGSSVFGGSGKLVFADLSDYDQFQIDVQLLDIQGNNGSQTEPLELWFSPMVYDSASYKFFNAELLSLMPGQNTATGSMNISMLAPGYSKKGDWIFELGYEIHMDDPTIWPSEGVTVTLLLSPTYGATQLIPEPMTFSLFAFGSILLNFKKKKQI